jgi:hypothetical protein
MSSRPSRARSTPRWKQCLVGTSVAAALAFSVYEASEVDDSLTPSDRSAIQAFLDGHQISLPPDGAAYPAQVEFLRRVQSELIDAVPVGDGIPLGHTREPADVLAAKTALCFDRSRVIEKIARMAGMTARHVFLLQDLGGESKLVDFLSQRESSHAVTEVRTARGWLLVDSNFKWISIDGNGDPLSAGEIRDIGTTGRTFERPSPEFYAAPFFYVYGLYSRHGQFYPPFGPLPDLNYRELLFNLISS